MRWQATRTQSATLPLRFYVERRITRITIFILNQSKMKIMNNFISRLIEQI